VTVPCVGDAAYLRRQFALLEPDRGFWPEIVDLPRKYHFGKLYREFYQLWLELYRQTGVLFDLLYDPKGWRTLLAHRKKLEGPLLYLHQGGLKGNESMLPRYRRKYPDLEEKYWREYEDLSQQR
jgi:1-aminocyclopropane-1-carboxylate deaminase/D-cysteine desulfhydrase-like pyridoxal-dependent ACC family enzyme